MFADSTKQNVKYDGLCCNVLCVRHWSCLAVSCRLAERLDGQLDPFDDTRVHPECYNTQDWAQRICANALDVQVLFVIFFYIIVDCLISTFLLYSVAHCCYRTGFSNHRSVVIGTIILEGKKKKIEEKK